MHLWLQLENGNKLCGFMKVNLRKNKDENSPTFRRSIKETKQISIVIGDKIQIVKLYAAIMNG